jgi:hypothetical protein
MYVIVNPIEFHLFLGLVKRRYLRIFITSHSIPNTIHTRKLPCYKPSKNGANTLKEQTEKADAYLLIH